LHLRGRLVATVIWMLLVGIAPVGALAADDARGEELFALCSQCHGASGGGNRAALAPAIAGLDQWYVELQLSKFRSGLRGTHPQDVGGLRMYPMSLWLSSDEDVSAVARYVASLPPARPAPQLAGGDAERGKQLYTPCVACHGVDGSGNQALKGAPLAKVSDWYLLSSLQKFKSGVRGSDPADQSASMMRAMSNTLPDEQAMRDVVAHIMALRE
jgi:cytochrome c553